MRFTKTTTMLLALAVAATPVLAKKDKAKEKADAPAAQTQAASGGSGSEAAAIVGGETITLDDLDKAAAAQLARIRQQDGRAPGHDPAEADRQRGGLPEGQ